MPEGCGCVLGNDPAVSTQAVHDCPVHRETAGQPPDPVAASHAGSIMVLETFRGLRSAGGGLLDSAFLTAAFVIANAAANKAAEEG